MCWYVYIVRSVSKAHLHIQVGGTAFSSWGSGVVLRVDWQTVGFADLNYEIRLVSGKHELVQV